MTTEIEVLENECRALYEEIVGLRARIQSKKKQIILRKAKIFRMKNDYYPQITKQNYKNSSLDSLITDEKVF